MTFKFLAVFLIFILTAQSIFLGMKGKSTRCLVEYIVGSGLVSTIKLKISLPQIENVVVGEHFMVSLTNTETNKTAAQAMRPGTKYIKEQQFDKNVIYEICITFRTDRNIQAVVEYQAETGFNYQHSVVKVPANLLNKSDFEKAFISATYLSDILAEYTREHKDRKTQQNKEFNATENISHKMQFISAIELIVLVASGLYQFYTLRNYLSTKQYI